MAKADETILPLARRSLESPQAQMSTSIEHLAADDPEKLDELIAFHGNIMDFVDLDDGAQTSIEQAQEKMDEG